MLTIDQYVRAESLEQAYELNQKKSARIIGGMLDALAEEKRRRAEATARGDFRVHLD